MTRAEGHTVRLRFARTMTLANEAAHEIHIVASDWRRWPVAPWVTVKHREWRLLTPKQRAVLLRRVCLP
jgi:hypothetical protein